MKKLTSLIIFALLVAGFNAATEATVPGKINYQAYVSYNDEPFNGVGYFEFYLVSASAVEWEFTNFSRDIQNGVLSIVLGETALGMEPIDPDIFAAGNIRLQVLFADAETAEKCLLVDTPLVTVPYSMFSQKAENATLANNAIHANTADYATNAGRAHLADIADYATTAGTANNALRANSADYATSAGNADTVDGHHYSSGWEPDDVPDGDSEVPDNISISNGPLCALSGAYGTGIGTCSPGYKLDVVADSGTDAMKVMNSNAGGTSAIIFYSFDNAVRGAIGFGNNSSVNWLNNRMYLWSNAHDLAMSANYDGAKLTLGSDGNVYIGANKSGCFVRFNDDIWFSDPQNGSLEIKNGGCSDWGTMVGHFNSPCSAEFKENIQQVESPTYNRLLADAIQTPLYNYNYINDDLDRQRLGVVIEECPEYLVGLGGTNLSVVEYVAMLHGAIKALNDQVETLKAEMAEISGR